MPFVVTTPAEDPKLLSVEQMRSAAGVAADDTSRDADLAVLNARVTSDICEACRIPAAGSAEPTLRRETITETFRPWVPTTRYRRTPSPLVLSRRHDVVITSISVDGELLDDDQYVVESDAGLLWRNVDGSDLAWTGRNVVVVYQAGFEVVPPGLVGAASDLVRLRSSETSRDPLVKSIRVDVDGVDEVETQYWVNSGTSSSSSPVPADIMAKLDRYRNAIRP